MKRGRYRKCVFVVAYAKTKKGIYYLILRRKLHWKGWEFPKGRIEFLETKRQTVKRELREETGLEPLKIKKFKIKGKYKYKKPLPDRPKYIGQTYRLFSAEVKKDEVVLDKREHSNYNWLTYKQAYKKLTWPNQKQCLREVNNYLKGSIF